MSRVRIQICDAEGGEREHHVHPGTTVAALLGDLRIAEQRIIAAVLNGHVVSLQTPLEGPTRLEPLDPDDPRSRGVLRRTMSHMLHAAAAAIAPEIHLCVGQSLLGGYFHEILPGLPEGVSLEEFCERLNAELTRMVEEDEAFEHREVPLEAALDALTDPFGSKARLLGALAETRVRIVRLGDFCDLTHGTYAPSTSSGRGVSVCPYEPGLILRFGPTEFEDPEGARRLWSCYRETREWNRHVEVSTVGALNRAILDDRFADVQRVAEALHERKVAEIAGVLADRDQPPRLVFIAGPSSAGKSTFAKRLAVQLRVAGLHPEIISLDDFYRPRDECPRDETGDYDFEALEALDVPRILNTFERLVAGDRVIMPSFDFVRGRPRDLEDSPRLKLRDGGILLVEGIHGLNPILGAELDPKVVTRIYVNALTQLIIDEHNRIFTSDTRLLRRLVRDRRYRGTRAEESLRRWPKVREGERRHIFPFQSEADVMFNSALVYEAPVLRTYAMRYLLEVPRELPERAEAIRLLRFLELFVPVLPDRVPPNSVLREFIGGSDFDY